MIDRELLQKYRVQIGAISKVTFQEIVREKILYSALLFGVLCVGLAFFVSRLSFADNARIALDFGLTSIAIVGGLISVVMGSTLVAKELVNRTHFLVLTKPIERWQFILGRYLGLLAVMCLNSLIMLGVLIFVMLVSGVIPRFDLFLALFLQLSEFAILIAIALVFSVLSTSTLAAVMTSGIWVIGHAMGDLRILSNKIEPYSLRPILRAIVFLLPDLDRFDVKALVSHQIPIRIGFFSVSTSYALIYVAFALSISSFLFKRKEL